MRIDDHPVAIVDEESNPPVVVARYERPELAEWHLGWLRDHGGTVLAEKVMRGGYGIDVPERMLDFWASPLS